MTNNKMREWEKKFDKELGVEYPDSLDGEGCWCDPFGHGPFPDRIKSFIQSLLFAKEEEIRKEIKTIENWMFEHKPSLKNYVEVYGKLSDLIIELRRKNDPPKRREEIEYPKFTKEQNLNCKLTWDDIYEIRKLLGFR